MAEKSTIKGLKALSLFVKNICKTAKEIKTNSMCLRDVSNDSLDDA